MTRSARRAALLAFAAALAAVPAGAQPPAPPLAGTRLDVVATGEATRVPDLAEMSAGVVTQAATAADAMRQNAERMAATRAALTRAGIAPRDIRTASVGLQPQYRYADNVPPVVTGYQASNTLAVRFRDVAKAGPVLDALVAAGANQINGPNLTVDRLDAALDEARSAAVAIARARAELYAKAAGMSVARIVSISEAGTDTPSPPMPMAAMRMVKAAATEIAPGEQRLAVTVNVSFELR